MAQSNRNVRIVVVGDELLAGAHPDLNTPELARELARVGLAVSGVELVEDREEAIAAALERAIEHARLVICSGGLGPTLDDVTRHGVARALGVPLSLDEGAMRDILAWYTRRGTPMPKTNERQALLPDGAVAIHNRVGTAPGFRMQLPGSSAELETCVIALPGPPAELRVVLGEEVIPFLVASKRARPPLGERRFHLFGVSESDFAEKVGGWMDRDAEPRMGCSAKHGRLLVSLRAGREGAEGARLLDQRAQAFRDRFREYIYTERDRRLETVLGEALIRAGLEVSLAESCTGGLASAYLTRVPGISAVFRRSFVTYADEVKAEVLGVPRERIREHGVVSEEVARDMAAGAARVSGARLAIAVTGIAGPDGASAEKPLGLVCFATSLDGVLETFERRFPPGERNWIRTLASHQALFLGWRRLRDAGLAEVESAHCR